MATALKLRRGTTVQHSTFTGAEGEVTVDTTKDTLVVHDNATAGGFPVVTETGTQTLTNKTFVAPELGTPASGTLTNCTFPTLNQNTTGTASNVTGVVAIANGGTNNSTLGVTDGGIVYADGTRLQTTAAGTSGQVLTSNGTDAPSFETLNVSGALNNIQYFTTVGTATYTPTAGTSFVVVEVVGGGCSGRRAVGTVNAGGTTSFGSLVSATGGTTTVGGVGASGDINLSGGNNGISTSAVGSTFTAAGASAPVYCASHAVAYSPSNTTGLLYGGGGGGLSASSGTATGGAAGGYAKKLITSAFSGVTVTVGAGGASGGTGSSAGAQGICIVWEYK